MTLADLTPVLSCLLVLVIGAALRPPPLPRSVTATEVQSVFAWTPPGQTFRPRMRRRRTSVDAMNAASWCDELARAVRSGATLTAALRSSTVPAGAEPMMEVICLALDRGQPLVDALRPDGSSSPHVDVMLTVLRACARHGGTAAEPLDRAAATLRARAADHADRLTQSAQARMSAVVMTCLPMAMLALMMLTSGSVRTAVFSPVGLLAVGVGTMLNVTGWMWMRHTIGGDAS